MTYSLENLIGQDGGQYKCDFDTCVPLYLTILHKKIECPTSLDAVNMGEKLDATCSLLKQGSEEVKLKWKITDIILDRYAIIMLV